MPSSTAAQTALPIPTIPTGDLAATQSLESVLRSLGLAHAASLLDAACAKAIARNDSPTSLLDSLMRDELRVQLERRAQAALKRSAIFPLTTLDTFDFDYPKSIDRALVLRAASLDFIAEKANCVFVGPSGVGKTHLANAIGQLACLRGHRVRFATAADLVNDLVAGQALNFDARGADLLYQVFNRRYPRAATIVTTNLAFKDWGTLFHNSAAASAIADRLVHKGLLIRIAGKSRRSDQEVE